MENKNEGTMDKGEVKEEEEERKKGRLERDFVMEEEMERAIRNCKDKSSPGMDQIDYKMIKRLPTEIKENF